MAVALPPPPRSSLSAASAQNREKRHSFSALNSSHQHQGSNRHSAEILGVDDEGQSAHGGGGEKHRDRGRGAAVGAEQSLSASSNQVSFFFSL